MSPRRWWCRVDGEGLPRTRGDEPKDAFDELVLTEFAPHPRE